MDISKFHNLDVVMICGLYGSGKSHYSKTYFRDMGRLRISRSEIRKFIYEMMHFGESWGSEHFNEEDDILIKHIERKMIEHFEHHKKKILIDNTFTSIKSRARIIKIIKGLKKTVGIIFLNTPVEKCMERNKSNPIQVPDNIIVSLKTKLELPQKSEGFDAVLIIDDY